MPSIQVSRKEKGEMKIDLTPDLVRAMIDRDKPRPECPMAVAKKVYELDDPKAKIPEIRELLDCIRNNFFRKDIFVLLENDRHAGQFINNIDALIQIKDAAGERAHFALEFFFYNRRSGLFFNNIDAFVQIAKASGEGTDFAYGALNDKRVEELFTSNKDAFVVISESAGTKTGYAYRFLKDEQLCSWFLRNPKKTGMLVDLMDFDRYNPKYEEVGRRTTSELTRWALRTTNFTTDENYELLFQTCKKAKENSKEYLIPSIISTCYRFLRNDGITAEDTESFKKYVGLVIKNYSGETAMKSLERFALFYSNEKKSVSDFPTFADYVLKSESKLEPYVNKYGARPARFAEFLNGKKGSFDHDSYNVEIENRIRRTIENYASEKNLNPNFLATVIFQEGFVITMIECPDMINKKYSLSNWGTPGAQLDYFYADMRILKKNGYLREDFGENGEIKVHGRYCMDDSRISFRDVDVFFEAFSAELAWRRDRFFDSLKELGIDPKTLSKEQEWAGTYLFFNAKEPESKLQNIVEKKGLEGLLEPVRTIKADVDNYRYNYMRVVSSASYLNDSGVFK